VINELIDSMEFSKDFRGYILKLYDGRKVCITFERDSDSYPYGYFPHYCAHQPVIESISNYNLKISQAEKDKINDFLSSNKEVMEKANLLDTLWEEFEDTGGDWNETLRKEGFIV
jgi:hypothetical protein